MNEVRDMPIIERYWPANRHIGKDTTPDVTKLVKSIRKVIEVYGTDTANRAYAEAMSDALRKEWAEDNSLVQVDGGHQWLVSFLGQTCICMSGGECGLAECEAFGIPYLDHISYWEGEDGRPVLVAQPYGLPNMRELKAWADRYDLSIRVSVWSFYFPGRSLKIEVQRRGNRK